MLAKITLLFSITSTLLAFNLLAKTNLSPEQEANIKTMIAELPNISSVQSNKPDGFLAALKKMRAEVDSLNSKGFGFRSSRIDNAAAKMESMALSISNSLKIARGLSSASDLRKIHDSLMKDNNELSAIKKNIDKSYYTKERTLAKDYLIATIEVMEMLIDDAIASVPLKD